MVNPDMVDWRLDKHLLPQASIEFDRPKPTTSFVFALAVMGF